MHENDLLGAQQPLGADMLKILRHRAVVFLGDSTTAHQALNLLALICSDGVSIKVHMQGAQSRQESSEWSTLWEVRKHETLWCLVLWISAAKKPQPFGRDKKPQPFRRDGVRTIASALNFTLQYLTTGPGDVIIGNAGIHYDSHNAASINLQQQEISAFGSMAHAAGRVARVLYRQTNPQLFKTTGGAYSPGAQKMGCSDPFAAVGHNNNNNNISARHRRACCGDPSVEAALEHLGWRGGRLLGTF